MRRTFQIWFVALSSCLCRFTLAEEPAKLQEPEYVGVFMWRNPQNGQLVSLERQTSRGRVQNKALGYAGSVAISEIDGEASPNRFKTGQKLDFVVRVASRLNDPLDSFGLYKVEPRNGKRQLAIQKAGFINSKKDTSATAAVPFNAAKYGEYSFTLSPAAPLLAGEYILGVKGSPSAFCFGIDNDSAGVPAERNSGPPSKNDKKREAP